MSLFLSRARISGEPIVLGLVARIRRFREGHLRRKAARAQLERLLAVGDDHLLDDVGIDRETARRLLGENLFAPQRIGDRWQL